MKTVKRTMHFPKFNEKCNDFEYEKRTYERPMTAQERKASLVDVWISAISISTIALSLVLFIIAVGGNFEMLGIISLITTLFSMLIAVLYETIYAKKKIYPIISNMSEIGFEAEELLYDQVAQEENDKAAKWRAEHEFEELIRNAKLTANCVDIANAAKYYAKHYIKGDD